MHDGPHAYNPLKIGIMGNQQYNASMLLYHGKVFFLIIILHPAAELLERHAQHLHLFQHIVADIMVELALYLHQFGFRLLRKGIAKVAANDFLPIMHDVAHQEVQPVRQCIKRPERQKCHKPHARISQPIDNF